MLDLGYLAKIHKPDLEHAENAQTRQPFCAYPWNTLAYLSQNSIFIPVILLRYS